MLAPAGAQSPPSDKLKVVIVEGEGAVNNIRQRSPREVVVQVKDDKDQPVSGAAVSLTLPAQGPGGTFGGSSRSATLTTDAQGMAVARGLRPNQTAGKFEIRVSVSHHGQTARATITQFNMSVQEPSRKSGHGKIIAILAVVGAAAAGGAYAGLHKGGSTTTAPAAVITPPIGITPGTATVGAPQ
jgi:hypothetical protein